MKSSRVRLAARIAALEAFREERERQQLAVARRAAMDADSAVVRAERTWLEIETVRREALAVRHDLGRYLTWGELAVQASLLHEEAVQGASEANAHAGKQSDAWATAKVRADATDDRASRLARDERSHREVRQEAERMELWLRRQERLS